MYCVWSFNSKDGGFCCKIENRLKQNKNIKCLLKNKIKDKLFCFVLFFTSTNTKAQAHTTNKTAYNKMCFKWCSSVRLRQWPVLNHICFVLSCLMTMVALKHYDYESDCQMCFLVQVLKGNFYCRSSTERECQ